MTAVARPWALRLQHAEQYVRPLAPFAVVESLGLADAYAIQADWIAHKQRLGAAPIGHKIGFTSPRLRRALQVDYLAFGVLMDDMLVASDQAVPLARYIEPRVEVELAFVMKAALGGPDPTLEQVLDAIEHVVPALEVIDGRVGPAPSALDIIADNAGCAAIVLGNSPHRPEALDLCRVGARLYRNGVVEDSGVSGVVLGHPALGLLELVRGLHERGESLQPGDVVLGGAFIGPQPVACGDTLKADYGPLGCVSIRFV